MEFCCGLYKHEMCFFKCSLSVFLRINKCSTQFYGKTAFLKIQIKVNSYKGTSSTLFIYAITVSTKNSKQNKLGTKAKKNNLQNEPPLSPNISYVMICHIHGPLFHCLMKSTDWDNSNAFVCMYLGLRLILCVAGVFLSNNQFQIEVIC